MWRVRLLSIVIVLALAATRTVGAQPASSRPARTFTRSSRSTASQFRGLSTSPDGRWLTIDAEDGIWIMPADGRAKPTRLLSAGYADRSPNWFLSGDRLAFMSDRASRDGSHKMYAMTVPSTRRRVRRRRRLGRSQPTRCSTSDKSRPTESG